MQSEKAKRISISQELYDIAMRIGLSNGANGTNAHEVGIKIALEEAYKLNQMDITVEQCSRAMRFNGLDDSIINNIEAIFSLSKNVGQSKEEINKAINSQLKQIIIDIAK